MIRPVLIFLFLFQPVAQASPVEIVLIESLFGHQQHMKKLEDNFNAHHKNVRLRIEYRDIHNNEVLANLKVNQPTAILMPTDKLGNQALRFATLEKDWLPASLNKEELNLVSLNGRYYGVPIVSGNHLVLFYNKSLVKKPATSWKEFFTQAAELKAKGIAPLGFPVDSPYYLIPFLEAFNGGLFDAQGNPTLNTPENLSAAKFYRSLYTKDMVLKGCGWDCGKSSFHQEKVAYSIDIDAAVFNSRKALGDKFGVAPLPDWQGRPMVSYYTTMALFMPEQDLSYTQKKAMKRLIDFFTSMETQQVLATEQYLMPVHYGVHRALQNHEDPIVQILLQQLLVAKPVPHSVTMHKIWMSLGENLFSFLEGDITAKELLNQAQYAATKP